MDKEFSSLFGCLVNAPQVAIGIKGERGEYLFVNPAYAQLLGRKEEAILGLTDEEVLGAGVAEAIHDNDMAVWHSKKYNVSTEHIPCGPGFRSYLAIRFPILDQQGDVYSVGVLALETKSQLCELASAGHPCDAKEELQAATRMANTDRLTNIPNRASFERTAHQEIQRLQRFGHPVCIIMVDVDHFKRVNDSHGHLVGDQVLVSLVAIIQSSLRTTDLLARWGGEEFVVLTSNTPLAKAHILAERIRQNIATTPFAVVNQITASFGVAECQERENLDLWFGRADKALYRAKKEGRNRVVCDQSTTTHQEHLAGGFLQLHWKEVYCSGHATMDQQHQSLFRHANAVLNAMLSEMPPAEVQTAIDQLLQEVTFHFREEEKLLHWVGYPDHAAHCHEHNALLQKASTWATAFQRGEGNLGGLVQFLTYDVVLSHLMKMDREYFPWVQGERSAANIVERQ